MVNQRDPKQRITAVWMRDELLAVLDKARSFMGKDRSQFIRDAIVEKLRTMGVEIPGRLAYPPDRAESLIANESAKPSEVTPAILKAQETAEERRRSMKPRNSKNSGRKAPARPKE